jgi:hypothetical protein
MAFRFNDARRKPSLRLPKTTGSKPSRAAAGMTWTLPQKPVGPAKLAMFVVRPLLNLAFRRFLSNLRRYTDTRFRHEAAALVMAQENKSLARPAAASKVTGIV